MKFKLKEYNRNISDKDLLDDLAKVAKELNKMELTKDEYDEHGKYSGQTLKERFSTWNNAIEKVGLNVVVKYNASEEELFRNLEEVWIQLGRQPLTKELKRPLSKFSTTTYKSKYGSYMNALRAFIEFINAEKDETVVEIQESISEITKEEEKIFKHVTKRNPSERLKVKVLMRDGNKCRLCGITLTGDNIHFDHILPWSKGGETVLENIQVLCEQHNLAKGNLYY